MNAQLSESGASTIPATNPETAKRKRPNFRLLEQANEVIAEHEQTIAALAEELAGARRKAEAELRRAWKQKWRYAAGAFALGLLLGAVLDAAVRAVL